MAPCSGCDAPILVVQWGPDAQRDGAAFDDYIRRTMGGGSQLARAIMGTKVCILAVVSPDWNRLVAELNHALMGHQLVALYIGAHGDCRGLSPTSGDPGIDFDDLLPALAGGLARQSDLTIVFGACNVFTPDDESQFSTPEDSPIGALIPPTVSYVIGFPRPVVTREAVGALEAVLEANLRRQRENLGLYARYLAEELDVRFGAGGWEGLARP